MKLGRTISQLLILIGIVTLGQYQIYCQTGPNYSSSATNDGTGTIPFTNPSFAAGSTTSNYATVSVGNSPLASDYLQFTGFGFSITDGDAIDGIKVEVKGFVSNNNLRYTSVYLINSGTIQTGGTNHGPVVVGKTDGIKSMGSNSDLWGIGLTEAQVEAANFGVAIRLSKINATGGARTGNIDWVRITVYHSSPSVSTFTSNTSGNWNIGTTWGNGCASGCVAGIDYPSAVDKANIKGGHTITIPSGFSASCFKLIMNSDLSNTLASNLTFGSSATSLTVNNFINIKSSFANTASVNNTIAMSGGTINLNGDLYMEANRINSTNWGALINVGGGTLTVTGNIDLTSNNNNAKAEINLTTADSKLIMSGDIIELGVLSKGQLINLSTDCTVEYSGSSQDILVQVGNTPLTYDKLALSGSGTKTALSNLTINGKLSIQGTTTLDLDGNTLTYGTNSSLEYKGTATQTTGEEMNAIGNVQTLIIDNSNGVNLSASKTIDDALTLTNGKLTLGTNNLTLTSGATITGQSTTKYVVTNSTGYLELTTAGSTIYPIGSSLYYDPITITPTSDAGFRTRVGTGPNNSPFDPLKTIQIEWQLATTGSPGATALLFEWDRTNQEGASFQANDGIVRIGQYTSQWAEKNASYSENSPVGRSSASAGGYTSFGAFAVGADNGSLPIKLLSFSVQLLSNSAQIKWKTSVEINNDFFTIMRSSDGKVWNDLYTITGAGNSNVVKSYQVLDNSPLFGKSYYMLRQTDFDGKYEDFQIVTVLNQFNDQSIKINMTPNPISKGNVLNLDLKLQTTADIKVSIRNIEGKLFDTKIYQKVNPNESLTYIIDDSLPKGLYLIEAVIQNKIYTGKLVIKE